jgi:hypothetical protein
MENVATYSEARSEYTKQLATFIVPALVSWFQQLWGRNSNDRQRCLSLFQNECEEVARWNQDRIHDEVRVLIERTGCDYMEELMTAVFVAHTKVLTAVRLSSKQKKLSITVPKLDHFIHRVFREAARCFWKTPFLFVDTGAVIERQKNVLQIEALATEAITTAVRSLLPVKQILQDYLEDDNEEIEDESVAAVAAAVAPVAEAEATTAAEVTAVSAVAAPEPAAAAPTQAEVKDVSATPAVVKIDTEPTVHFSEYDAVFQPGSAPTMEFKERGDDEAEADGEDEDYGPSDGALVVNEGSTTPVGIDDAEDLDAPLVKAPVPAPAPASASKKEEIDDGDVEILD